MPDGRRKGRTSQRRTSAQPLVLRPQSGLHQMRSRRPPRMPVAANALRTQQTREVRGVPATIQSKSNPLSPESRRPKEGRCLRYKRRTRQLNNHTNPLLPQPRHSTHHASTHAFYTTARNTTRAAPQTCALVHTFLQQQPAPT